MQKILAETLGDRVRIDHPANLSQIKSAIERNSADAGISVIVELDEAKIGGGLFNKPVDCIAVYNTNHKRDYYCLILAQEYQGNTPFLCTYTTGTSKNWKKEVISKNTTGFTKLLTKPSAKKQNDESWYYDTMWSIISSSIAEFYS